MNAKGKNLLIKIGNKNINVLLCSTQTPPSIVENLCCDILIFSTVNATVTPRIRRAIEISLDSGLVVSLNTLDILIVPVSYYKTLKDYIYTSTKELLSYIKARQEITVLEDYQGDLPSSSMLAKKLPHDKKVLFFAPYGSWTGHNTFECVIAASLKARGSNSLVVTCDGIATDSCYVLKSSSNPEFDCTLCSKRGLDLFQAFHLPVLQLRNYIENKDLTRIQKWAESLNLENLCDAKFDELPVGLWVMPIVSSYFRIPRSHFTKEHVKIVHKKYCIYALITYFALGKILDQANPDHIVMFNGAGAFHSAAFELAKQRGIPVMTHESGYVNGSYLMVDNAPAVAIKPQLELVDQWGDVPLAPHELNRLRETFIAREEGTGLNRLPFYTFKDDHLAVRAKLNIPLDATIISAFTSSEYEMIYLRELDDAPSQREIIDNLFEVFKDRDEYLVIRHHPYIGGISGGLYGPPDYELIKLFQEQAARAPKNVRVVMPDEELTSYSLLWTSSAALTFFSSIGFEAVARGIPSATLRWGIYHKATTHIIEDFSESGLNKLINDLLEYQNKFSESDLRRLYRTMNTFYYRYSSSFTSFSSTSDGGEVKLNISSSEDLLPGKDPSLDRACNYLLNNEPLLPEPTNLDFNIDQKSESAFYKSELDHLKNFRNDSATKLIAPLEYKQSIILDLEVSKEHRKSTKIYHNNNRYLKIDRSAHNISSLQELLPILKNLSNEFVIPLHNALLYNESHIIQGIEKLKSTPALGGVLNGAWIGDSSLNLISTLGTKKSGFLMREGISFNIALLSPLKLLCLGLYRTSWLINLIESTPIDLTLDVILTRLCQEDIVHTNIPTVCIYPSSLSQTNLSFKEHGVVFTEHNPSYTKIREVEEKISFELMDQMIMDASSKLETEPVLALELLEKITKFRKDTPDIFFLKAVAEARLGKIDDAFRSLIAVLERNPEHEHGRELFQNLKILREDLIN